jgi:hypothetical protein
MNFKEHLSEIPKTLVEVSAVYIASRLAGKVLDHWNIPHGNRALRKDSYLAGVWKNDPRSRRIIGLVVAPLSEEIESREVPRMAIHTANKLLGMSSKNLEIMVSAISSVRFALDHNYWQDEDGNLHFDKSVPLEQLMFAAYAWRVNDKRGLPHAILAHFGFNLLHEIEYSRKKKILT